MTTKEILATEYTFFRYPNLHFLFLIPMLPSVMVIMLRSNLYGVTNDVYTDAENIISGAITDYFLFYKSIMSIIVAFFIVYKWSQAQADGSYGFWITQNIDPVKYIFTAIATISLVTFISQSVGVTAIILYLGLQVSFISYVGLLAGILLSSLLFSSVAFAFADFIPRPEIAGLVFVGLSGANSLFNNGDGIFNGLFKLEDNFLETGYVLLLLFETLIVLALFVAIYYTRRLKDLNL